MTDPRAPGSTSDVPVGSQAVSPPGWGWRLLVAAPWLMLAISALCWLRFGVDMPFVDDWRAYADGTAGQWAPGLWFTATNNTIAPVGLALDALAQRVLGGNVIAYQFISLLLVLGGLLICQWRLLRWALGDVRLAALAFAATAFMLQSGSYWGEQNMAYHQALPLLWLMGALAFGLTSQARPVAVLFMALLLGVLAGLSYISGAAGTLVLALALWAVLWLIKPLQGDAARRARALALGLLLAGQLGCAVQAWAMGASTDAMGVAIPKAWPTQAAFWAYALGKLGRTLGQPFAALGWDALLVAGLWLLAVGVLLVLAVQTWRARKSSEAQEAEPKRTAAASTLARVALVALPLAAMLAMYLMLVAHGRANFRDAGVQTSLQVYAFGYVRFHHFWLTLIWPWVLAALAALLVWRAASRSSVRQPDAVSGSCRQNFLPVGVVLLVLLLVGGARSVFNLADHYRSAANFRAEQWLCLTQQWGSGGPIRCPIFDMPDATGALLYAQHIGASFTRYLPLGRTVEGRELWRWSAVKEEDASDLSSTLHDARMLAHVALAPETQVQPSATDESGAWLRTGNDAQWLLRWPAQSALAQQLAQCQVLDVAVQVQASRAGALQVFFAPLGHGAPQFDERWAPSAALQPPDAAHTEAVPPLSLDALNQPPIPPAPPAVAAAQTLHLALANAQGFAPQLRIDLADQPMWVRVADLRISCRLPTLAAWRAGHADAAQGDAKVPGATGAGEAAQTGGKS